MKTGWVAKVRRTRTQAYTANWQAISAAVLKRDGYRCRKCGRTKSDGVRLEANHIVPICRGGTTAMYNLETLCERCHSHKPFHNHMR